jgi:hypothetical protein
MQMAYPCSPHAGWDPLAATNKVLPLCHVGSRARREMFFGIGYSGWFGIVSGTPVILNPPPNTFEPFGHVIVSDLSVSEPCNAESASTRAMPPFQGLGVPH